MKKYERLEILREITKLDLLSAYKLHRACRKAENLRDLMARKDPSHTFSVDYTPVNELELELRMQKLQSDLKPVFNKYEHYERDKLALCEFAEGHIERYKEIRDREKVEFKGRTLKL